MARFKLTQPTESDCHTVVADEHSVVKKVGTKGKKRAAKTSTSQSAAQRKALFTKTLLEIQDISVSLLRKNDRLK